MAHTMIMSGGYKDVYNDEGEAPDGGHFILSGAKHV